jgi:hypothetical protein
MLFYIKDQVSNLKPNSTELNNVSLFAEIDIVFVWNERILAKPDNLPHHLQVVFETVVFFHALIVKQMILPTFVHHAHQILDLVLWFAVVHLRLFCS